ncbi:MAG: DeoR/GlpR transcriptional regulator [Roseitalea sp.]|nr:DeoR/GlpR transcriptional regulator [Roseitalea sp.]MBO6743731.1 DeoR/GlpR transcriptional regulator [Roseitalea sp.]
MKVRQRQEKIVAFVRKNEQVTIEQLANWLGTSRETIRRDVSELAKNGHVQKVHGGAKIPELFGDGSFRGRMSTNAGAKTQIAATAIELFNPGETLFVVTGSTTLYFAERLRELANLTIVTNSGEIAKASYSKDAGHRIFLLGGEFNAANNQTIGAMVVSQIRTFRAHHTVLTIGALDDITGAMNFSIDEAQIAAAMIERSQSVTVLVDSSKFSKLASFEVCPLNRIDRIICEAAPEGSLRAALDDHDVEIVVAGTDRSIAASSR